MRILLLLLLALCGSLAALAYLALDAQPAITAAESGSAADSGMLKTLLRQNDPRRAAPGSLQQVHLNAAQVNRLLNGASAYTRLAGAHVRLMAGRMDIAASLRVPATPFGRFVNLRASVVETPGGGLAIRHLHAGRLPIPGPLADPLAQFAWRRFADQPTYGALLRAVQGVELAPGAITIRYRWTPRLLALLEQQSAALLLDEDTQARLLAYEAYLRHLLKPYAPGSRLPLAAAVGPLFRYAHGRGSDAAAENRAAWQALSAYMTGVSLPHLLAGRRHRRAPDVALTLYGRQDAAEHYVVAAALAATAGRELAENLGLAKEEEDLSHGSGFSFTDLGWDFAGARVGQGSTQTDTAERMQTLLADARNDRDLSPSFRDLPEFLAPQVFQQRYGRIGSPAYTRVIEQIQARLQNHSLTRAPALKQAA